MALVYTLTSAVCITVVGCVTDIFGRRPVFIGGAVLGVVGSVVAAAATSVNLGGASGMAGSIRFLISSVAASIYNAILSNRLAETIPATVPAAVVAEGLPESSVADFIAGFATGSFDGVSGLTDAVLAAGTRAYKEANADAFRTIFYANIGFSVAALVCALCLPDVDKYLTSKVAATLHQGRDENKIA